MYGCFVVVVEGEGSVGGGGGQGFWIGWERYYGVVRGRGRGGRWGGIGLLAGVMSRLGDVWILREEC